MAIYDRTPDPYRYERIGTTAPNSAPVYVVWLGDRELGVIQAWRRSTDRQMGRLRHPGKGAPAFIEIGNHRVPYDRRRDVAEALLRRPWTKAAVAFERRLCANRAKASA